MSITFFPRLSIDNINRKKNLNLTPKKERQINKSFQMKKIEKLVFLNNEKITDIKDKRRFSSFQLIGEDSQYKQIERQLQNTILNISAQIIQEENIQPDMDEKRVKNRKKRGSVKSIFNSNKKLLTSGIDDNSHNLTYFKEIIKEKSRRLKKINKLYDSSAEDESDKDMLSSNYGLNPKSIFIDVYDIIILISILFYLLYIPIKLAKNKMIINNDEYFVLFIIYFSELICILDLIISFFRWFYNNEFKLINDSYLIFNHYFYGYFLFDLIMAVPFYSIYKYKYQEKSDYNLLYDDKNYILKIVICLKAFKIFKLNQSKNNRLVYFFNRKFAKIYYMERIYQIIQLLFMIISMLNLFICFHIYLAEISYPNWIVSSNIGDYSFIDKYVASLYFIVATITSVGYGDIVCISKEETLFQIILLSIGLVAYSWIISTVADRVKNKNRAQIKYNKDMAKLEAIRISYPNMPFKLYNKIQQHIQRLLTQQKKMENNILINSLPYYLQNSVLFQIYKEQIEKFIFFKNCDNSDFVLKVLTHLIPLFTKKDVILVGEGEFLENIFFIKYGRLSLEAIIDLNQIENSVEKYLKYRFEDIEAIEDFYDNENSFQKSNINDISLEVSINKKRKNLIEIIKTQFENIEDIPAMDESNIEQEIGKYDFQMEKEELYKGNIKYIHILDLLKNEYFGDILMFMNIPNPLSLKVKSKRAELYVLRKKDAFNIKRDYQNIWQRINKKSIHNLKSLKSLTLDIINRYCEMNGIIVRNQEIIKSTNKPKYSSRINSKDSYKITKNEEKTRATSKFKPIMSQNLTSLKSSFRNGDKNCQKLQYISANTFKNKSGSKTSREKSLLDNSESSFSSLSYTIEKSINKNNNNEINKESQNKLINYYIQQTNFQKYKNLMAKGSISPANKLSNLSQKSPDINKTQKLSNKNFKNITSGVSTINEFCSSSSFSSIILAEESTISLNFSSSYKNINEITKGKYIRDKLFQDATQNFLENYIKLKSKKKVKRYFSNMSCLNYLAAKKNISQKHFFRKNISDKTLVSKINKNNISDSSYFDSESISHKENNLLKYGNKRKFSCYKKRANNSISNRNIIIENNSKKKDKLQNEKIEEPYKYKNALNDKDNNNKNSKTDSSIIQLNSNNINNIQQKILDYNDNLAKHQLNELNMKNKEFIINKKIGNIFELNNEMKKKEPDLNNIISNNIINNRTGNNIHEVNLNYVNNICNIF